jgi:hypothetical protein
MGIKLYRHPRLKNPHMVAAWPGIGGVASGVASYLAEKLGAEEFGEIEPFDFFQPAGILVEGNVVHMPPQPKLSDLPRSRFYYWKNRVSENDIIIFIGEAQPVGKELEFARLVLDVAQKFKVKRIYTSAAAVASISHTQYPRVWAAATEKELLDYLRRYDVVLRDKIQVSGLNGLLLGVAKERGIDGICLLGEVPFYIAQMQIEYPKSSQAVLQVLVKMLGVEIDMSDMDHLVIDVGEKMAKLEQEIAERIGQIVIRPREEPVEKVEEVPESVRRKIERLFRDVEKDSSRVVELKAELDEWDLFPEYEDRFLNIFRRRGHGGD